MKDFKKTEKKNIPVFHMACIKIQLFNLERSVTFKLIIKHIPIVSLEVVRSSSDTYTDSLFLLTELHRGVPDKR